MCASRFLIRRLASLYDGIDISDICLASAFACAASSHFSAAVVADGSTARFAHSDAVSFRMVKAFHFLGSIKGSRVVPFFLNRGITRGTKKTSVVCGIAAHSYNAVENSAAVWQTLLAKWASSVLF